MTPRTHADLVELARGWLLRQGCTLAITEMASGAQEEPDAIGWKGQGRSIVVEVKVSRADLRRDKDKPCRRREDIAGGLGNERYVLMPEDIAYDCVDLVGSGWGALMVTPAGKVRKIRVAEPCESNLQAERTLLLSACRRLGVASAGGISVRLYTQQTKCRATLTVEGEGTASEGSA